MNRICVNGQWTDAGAPVLRADNRSYRYGDGLFETLLVQEGRVRLFDAHWARLQEGFRLLGLEALPHFTAAKWKEWLLTACTKNQCTQRARLRFSVYRGHGGLYDNDTLTGYVLEAWPLPPSVLSLNTNGLDIGVYTDARKSADTFSSLKTAQFLPYTLAARYARAQHWNDCLVLNTAGRVADSTIANLFIRKDQRWITPPLSEGPVGGVMRQALLEQLPGFGFEAVEAPLSPEEVEAADEVILTNAIYGFRWVKSFRNRSYTCQTAPEIYTRLLQTINPR